MKVRLLSGLAALMMATGANANTWLAESPVSFYEPNVETRLVAAMEPTHRFSYDAVTDNPATTLPDRPYGFGRELDDTRSADYDGLTRDALYFVGYQFSIVGILYLLPEDLSGWTEEQKNDWGLDKWVHNVTHPHWDDDLWWINWILHPYWGATYYIRGRERGLDKAGSFWYSVALSSLFEFGVEALFEPVSKQDLILTPVIGSVIGWYFDGVRREIKAQDHFSLLDKTVLIATDPLGSLNRVVDEAFGRGFDSQLKIRSFSSTPRSRSVTETNWGQSPYTEESNRLRYWGVQWDLRW